MAARMLRVSQILRADPAAAALVPAGGQDGADEIAVGPEATVQIVPISKWLP
jgi:hypothetical protein